MKGVSTDREQAFLRLIRGETLGLTAGVARLGLSGIAIGYGLATSLRNRAFDKGWKKVGKVAVPVVSVGNLTLGGTGKTPMVEWIARRLRREDLRVAILSRGYGQTDGVNDEAMVLEENLPDVPHLQGADRLKLAEIAVEELESEILILDDGFQHRRLGRDLDIVLIDALDPFGQGKLFPRGLLRESLRSLRRADIVVLSRADLVEPSQALRIREQVEAKAGPLAWVEARHAPIELSDSSGNAFPLSELRSKRVAAFCGIGNPEGFRRTLEPLIDDPFGFRIFPDHHLYNADDVADLGRWATSDNYEMLLTTQKDLVKLRTDSLGRVPLRALRIGLEVTEGLELLEGRLMYLSSEIAARSTET